MFNQIHDHAPIMFNSVNRSVQVCNKRTRMRRLTLNINHVSTASETIHPDAYSSDLRTDVGEYRNGEFLKYFANP